MEFTYVLKNFYYELFSTVLFLHHQGSLGY